MTSKHVLGSLLLIAVWVVGACGQTADTGAIIGTVTDPTGAVVPDAEIVATKQASGAIWTVTSGADGGYRIPLLPPGLYRIEAKQQGFKTASISDIVVRVTEKTALTIALEVGAVAERVVVESAATLVQTDETALGRVVEGASVTALPLVTRNYQHLMGLAPGAIMDVADAGAIGRASEDVFVHGARATDNNFTMDGVQVNNFHNNRASGVAVPSPDTIEEFKVQTGLWDASFGRQPGSNISIVTKGGGNDFHGSVFEFFRNEKLNATPFFINRVGADKPVLKQNQFGAVVGGPIVKDKFFFFGSYQATRQRNGLSSNSLRTAFMPDGFTPTGSPRTAAALGAIYGGQSGFRGGTTVAADGSNIHPIALAILNATLPDGRFVIPDPQAIISGRPTSTFSESAKWDEDQFMVNADYNQSEKSKFTGRFFYADVSRLDPLTQNYPGWGRDLEEEFRNLSLKHTYTFSPQFFNELKFGVHRTTNFNTGQSPISPADVGLQAPNPDLPHFPSMSVLGSIDIGAATSSNNRQLTFNVGDSVSYVGGKHFVRAGFDLSRVIDNFDLRQLRHGTITFSSFPDFLLGLDAASNGTTFSNFATSQYLTGLTDRGLRVTDWSLFVQDDWKLNPQLTLNLGLRFERLSFPKEVDGKLVNLWPELLSSVPPPTGDLTGFVAPANFVPNFGNPPGGGDVRVLDNNCALKKCTHNSWGPRLGLAWRPFPGTSRFVVRTGYGIFYTRLHGNNQLQLITNTPFIGHFRLFGTAAASHGWDNPWATPAPSYPDWHFRLPNDVINLENIAADFEPSIVQQWSLNLQVEFLPSYLLEVGYVGSKGEHVFGFRQPSMPLQASPSNPVHGETTNTLANISQRVPWLGFTPTGILEVMSSGRLQHHGMEVSVNKRFSGGLQFGVAYTWSKTMDDTNEAGIDASFGGWISNDQRDVKQAWGPSDFSRRHRLVANYLYEFPGPSNRSGVKGKLLAGWQVSGVTTIQSGFNLTVTDTNSGSIWGWPRFDRGRAELAPGATYADVPASGSTNERIDGWFNAAAFVDPPVLGDGFDFGRAGRGIIPGPTMKNWDLALAKKTYVGWLPEEGNIEFRAEFFNLFNTTQFNDPNNNRSSSSFGRITSTRVSPRVLQFALKLNF